MRRDPRKGVHYLTLDNFAKINRRRFKTQIVHGEIFVIRRALQGIDCFVPMISTSLEGIAAAAGPRVASAIREDGFESLHKHITGNLLFNIQRATYDKYKDAAPTIVPVVLRFLFGNGVYFYEKGPNVRFHVPFEFAKGLPGIGDFRWSGKIVPHGPHHDSWYDCPRNSIDVWIAVGRVEKGNGLSIYPDVFGKYLACDDDGKIGRSQRLGMPYNFEMDPGDIMIFNGEHLHGSELNCTNSTRHVVSFRITFSFLGRTSHEYRIVKIGANPVHKLKKALWMSKISRLKRGDIGKDQAIRFNLPRHEPPKTDHLASEAGAEPPLISTLMQNNLEFEDVVSLTQIAREAVKAIAPTICIARTRCDAIVLLARYCPHQAADLGAGYVKDNSLFCPWHNLEIDLRDGTTSCSAFSHVRILRRWANQSQYR